MTVTNDIAMAVAGGALGALAIAKVLGWLRFPAAVIGGAAAPKAAPTIVYAMPPPEAKNGPKYEATVNVPHKITIEPQVSP